MQELLRCLTAVVEEGNFFSMEGEIWEGVSKDPMVTTLDLPVKRAPSQGVPSLMLGAEEPSHTASPDPPSSPEPEEMMP